MLFDFNSLHLTYVRRQEKKNVSTDEFRSKYFFVPSIPDSAGACVVRMSVFGKHKSNVNEGADIKGKRRK